ncbi:MAG TPA: N-acetyl-gamma-glutamyl-phosphate reductase [Fimbriimonas sp.]|nr:N-acetyl-gamma-glutamyl-phosphate reductase [Fimbriimonas sp.]
MSKWNVAVVGATGYAGAEIVRLLSRHPCAQVSTVTSARSVGLPLRQECPWLATDLVLTAFDDSAANADVVFLCQESGFAMQHARTLTAKTRVIDLSADFRLKDKDSYKKYYKSDHADPDLSAVYGLPELVDREAIAAARLVANPGCYPTATLLGLLPLVKSGLISGTPVIDAKSGVSGAGRSRKETDYLFSELDGGFKAYALSGHRHTPEIEEMAGMPVRFSPHLLPIPRGIHATLHVPIKSHADLGQIYRDFYADRIFVAIQDSLPNTKQVTGSNRAIISANYEERTGYAVVCSVIDNLVKGAAGQAIQNMNIMLGLPEETGLPLDGLWP